MTSLIGDAQGGSSAASTVVALLDLLVTLRTHLTSQGDWSPSTERGPASPALHQVERLVAAWQSYTQRQPLAPTRVDVVPFVASFVKKLQTTLEKSIAVTFKVNGDCRPWHADPEALTEALMRLVVNSRTAMAEGGRIHLAAFAEKTGAGFTSLALTDTGIGMSRGELQRATTPFCTTKEDAPLAGMGLAAVHGFLAQSKGTMTISSHAGSGTTVTLTLPTWSDASGAS